MQDNHFNMANKLIKSDLFVAAFLVFIAAATRLIPHPFNFTAIGAMALFSGANLRDKRLAYILPFAAMFLTDLILGFHSSMLPVYLCFTFSVWLGIKLSKQQSIFKIAISSILSSFVFFLITNLPFWYLDIHLYPMSLQGVALSYTMALPFFANQLVGDLFFTGLLFSVYHVVSPSSSKIIA